MKNSHHCLKFDIISIHSPAIFFDIKILQISAFNKLNDKKPSSSYVLGSVPNQTFSQSIDSPPITSNLSHISL